MFQGRSLRHVFHFMHGNILVLTVTLVLGMFCRSMVFPYTSLYILALGGEAAHIGFVNSLMPLAGYLTDLAGRVRLIVLGGYLSGLILLMYIFAPSWEIIALAGMLQGLIERVHVPDPQGGIHGDRQGFPSLSGRGWGRV